MKFHRTPEAMRRFYDGFHPWYRFVEGNTGASIAKALAAIDPERSLFAGATVLEHCCGSASLGLEIAGRCAGYEGRDQSEGMLGRARARWRARFGMDGKDPFRRENILELVDPSETHDWAAIAFALHLFPPDQEELIVRSLWQISKRGVLIIEHGRGFSPLLSLIEAAEGSWYEHYKRIDFSSIARGLGARLIDREIDGARIMVFAKS